MRSHVSQISKSGKDFYIDDIRTQELADKIRAARASITDISTAIVAQKPNKWAIRRSKIRSSCSAFTDEEIGLYECRALTSWESR